MNADHSRSAAWWAGPPGRISRVPSGRSAEVLDQGGGWLADLDVEFLAGPAQGQPLRPAGTAGPSW